jgi:hypothetical protein
VAVLVTAALLVGGVLAVGEAASREAPPMAVPAGMVAPLDGPPWAQWRAPAARTDDVLAASGVLVVSSVRERRFTVTAYEATTGARVWERDLGLVSGTRPLTGCPHDGGDVGDVVLCVVEPRPDPDDWAPGTVPFPAPDEGAIQVTAMAAATGEVLSEWTVDGRLAAVERLRDDLVVMGVGEDGHAEVGRYAGVGGQRVWWYRGDARLRLREGIISGSEVRVNDSFVLVQGWSATVLDARTGEQISTTPPTWFVVGALAGDLFGTWTSGEGGSVRDRHGRELFTTRALFPTITASDGEPVDLLVMDEGGTLVGRALPDGAEQWRLDTYRAVRLQVDGRMVLLGVDGYQVVEVRTGAVAWESPYKVLMWWAPLTDGRVVLAAGRSGTGMPTMEARRLSDGELEWSLPLEDGVRSVSAVGGHLLLRTREELIVLG